jgi:integrase
VKIRITHNRKSDYISTDLFINPDQLKNGQATGNNAAFINMRIADLLQMYQRRYLDIGYISANMTVKELKDEIRKDKTEGIDFLEFAEKYQKKLIAEGKQGSERAVRGLLASLKKYRSNIVFSEITSNFLAGFENYLIKNGVGAGGIETYMSRFRLIFNQGREFYNDEDRAIIRIMNYPFKKYKVTRAKDKGRTGTTAKDNRLDLQQLKKFINYKPVTRREQLAQNIFLLMICLIGPNSKDLYYLRKPTREGRITYSRFKTGKEFSVKLEPEAAELAARYPGTNMLIGAKNDYTDYLNFQKAINTGLKSICTNIRKKEAEELKKAGLNYAPDFPAKITSNWARHTWATIARNDCRIPKDDVALCLGHEDPDNRVTDMYIKYDNTIADEANRKVIDLVFY